MFLCLRVHTFFVQQLGVPTTTRVSDPLSMLDLIIENPLVLNLFRWKDCQRVTRSKPPNKDRSIFCTYQLVRGPDACCDCRAYVHVFFSLEQGVSTWHDPRFPRELNLTQILGEDGDGGSGNREELMGPLPPGG